MNDVSIMNVTPSSRYAGPKPGSNVRPNPKKNVLMLLRQNVEKCLEENVNVPELNKKNVRNNANLFSGVKCAIVKNLSHIYYNVAHGARNFIYCYYLCNIYFYKRKINLVFFHEGFVLLHSTFVWLLFCDICKSKVL